MDELYLDNIDEFVNDHNKIVTYKWLSLTLGVHVNIAKQMLYHYLDHKRKESSAQLHATYLVTGKFVENGNTSHKVSVVREEQLEDVKSKMSLTVSVHVYSVQKAVLKDSSPLYNVDYDAVKDNPKSCSRYSAIKCAEAVPSSSEEVQRAREAPCVPAPEPPNNKASANGHGSLASKPAAKPPKGIMGMFSSKAAPKNQESKEIKLETKEDVAEGEVTKSKPAKKTNPMSNFFGSQATKRPERTVKDEGVTSSSSVEAIPSEKTEETVKEEMPKETKQDTRSKTKRKEESDSEEEVKEKKKRRRIKKPQPDSSDDDDEVIPDSPRQQEVRKLPPAPDRLLKEMSVPQPNECTRRKRRRVMKSRTFMDEEGCIVTEKGFESESYSESEDNTQSRKSPSLASKVPSLPSKVATTKKEDEKKGKKKTAAAANKGAKQPSIMGFFQKK